MFSWNYERNIAKKMFAAGELILNNSMLDFVLFSESKVGTKHSSWKKTGIFHVVDFIAVGYNL